MARWPVSSSVIKAVGYDPGRRILDVEFVGGRVYRYTGVDGAVYKDFMAAESKGRFFNQHIQYGYEFEQLT
ncbi:KTSC domain-containing protein [Amycolatopsis alkalitolerans]|uniref:KTSC domain-containing protein n=1 Tax=Amycolatopsis alkalitolerans TaxID=2547244 RepID=A0A5C4MCT0_9PSEU|nr:KTSC domain-containing protein [Amycolatopsis alkalitolerans]